MRRVAIVLFGVSAALLVAVVVLVSGSRKSTPPRSVPILAAQTTDDATLVDLTLGGCPQRLFTSVEEGPKVVRVAATGYGPRSPQRCTPRALVVLHRPLGDRTLLDRSSGAPITVEKVPAGALGQPGPGPTTTVPR
jgi:hypothetical protein